MSRLKNLLRNINYLSKHSLWDQREDDIVFMTNKIIDDISYEYDMDYPGKKKLTILSTDETLNLLETGNKSFIRTGDGEIALMKGEDHPFQSYNKEIADKMIAALENPSPELLVGLNRGYFIPLFQYGNHTFYRRHAFEFREFYRKHCSENVTYIDAGCTGLLEYSENKTKLLNHYERWKQLFADRNIAIICGEGLLDEFKYDIFELAQSKYVINCPRTNAWVIHDEIMERIQNEVPQDTLLVFILGQAGKAMITELAEIGYICWDVGHLAKYYNAIMSDMEWNDSNIASFYAPD